VHHFDELIVALRRATDVPITRCVELRERPEHDRNALLRRAARDATLNLE
jgi:hypothetical protein